MQGSLCLRRLTRGLVGLILGGAILKPARAELKSGGDIWRPGRGWLEGCVESSEIKDNFEQLPFCISSPGALKLDILARSSSQLEFQFSILFFTIRTAVLIFLFSI